MLMKYKGRPAGGSGRPSSQSLGVVGSGIEGHLSTRFVRKTTLFLCDACEPTTTLDRH